MDREFAADSSALLVAGAQTDLPLKLALSTLSGAVIPYLPNRVSLVATGFGIELWGRPGLSKYASIAWSDIGTIRPKKLPSGGRNSVGLRIELTGAGDALDIPITGRGVSGFPSVDTAQVSGIAEELLRLKASFSS
jgi:hypothetical protein